MATLLSPTKIPNYSDATAPFRATAIIVLYRIAPHNSTAFRSLMQAHEELRGNEGHVSILLWDNSPEPHHPIDLPEDVIYRHDSRNPGLALAYNHALELASQRESDWLITLDQDTTVPPDYLIQLATSSRQFAGRSDIGAIVPQIAIGKKLLSPYHFILDALPKWLPKGYVGIPAGQIFAFNSGAMIRVAALRQIGGYDPRFPLDQSDSAMFHRLHEHGKRVYVDGNIQLQHKLSFIDMNVSLNCERYRQALLAESAFWDRHMNWLAGCERTLRLFFRMIRQWARKDRRDLRQVTKDFLLLRIFRSRMFRLQNWRKTLNRNLQATSSTANFVKPRPVVSVCMAAYNGSRFIEQQLESILPQLCSSDEVVIIDDCSQDDTVARVHRINDSRIRLFRHESNQGIVATFEEALRCATGNILFLSDDDDLWAPNKVARFLHEFETHFDLQVATSKVALIDEDGFRLPDTHINRRGHFASGFWRNVAMNHYQGSAMVIRADLLGTVLPFPCRPSFLHDVWIGTRNDAAGGKTVFIDEPLVYYRRHSQNASKTQRPLQQLRIRIDLLVAHLARVLLRPGLKSSKASL